MSINIRELIRAQKHVAQVRDRKPPSGGGLLRLLIEELCKQGRFSLRGGTAEGSQNCGEDAIRKWGGS